MTSDGDCLLLLAATMKNQPSLALALHPSLPLDMALTPLVLMASSANLVVFSDPEALDQTPNICCS